MLLLLEMENYEEGDLTDIVRGGRSRGRSSSTTSNCKTELDEDQDYYSPFSSLQEDQDHNNNPHHQWSSSTLLQDHQYNFGDPFCSSDATPILDLHHHQHQLHNTSNAFFNGIISTTTTDQDHHELIIKTQSPSSNLFSRMLQISPSISSHNSPSNFLIHNHSINSPTNNPLPHHFLHHNDNNPSAPTSAAATLHISSPRNPPGIKRRKSQARKVVCVPAPVAASSRPNGEVIPSDLWAWRKYGQKPIKGSPYPRGYYRCSSSKGCSARKQVERSRTDPNMLVITYTSEHNHPWPTQRNALAGSSRSQQSKNNNTTSTTSSTKLSSSTTQDHQHKNKEEAVKEDEDQNDGTLLSPSAAAASNNVKEEEIIENHHNELMSGEGFDEDHDFFADLEELQTDHPLTLLFTTQQQQQQQPHKLDQIKEGITTTTTTTTTGCLHDIVSFNNLFDWPPPPPQNNNNSAPPPTTPTNRGFY